MKEYIFLYKNVKWTLSALDVTTGWMNGVFSGKVFKMHQLSSSMCLRPASDDELVSYSLNKIPYINKINSCISYELKCMYRSHIH